MSRSGEDELIPHKPNEEQKTGPVTELIVLPSSPDLERAAIACPLLDGGSVEEWIGCCTKRFLRSAAFIAGGDEQARDALQESWIKIVQKVGEYRGRPPACPWVRSVIVNCAKDIRKASSREEPIPDSSLEDPAPGAEASIQRKQLYRLLGAMVDELRPTYRQVFELRYGQGLSTAETAERLHISKANVSARLSRAVKSLRRSLAARIDGETSAPPLGGKTPA